MCSVRENRTLNIKGEVRRIGDEPVVWPVEKECAVVTLEGLKETVEVKTGRRKRNMKKKVNELTKTEEPLKEASQEESQRNEERKTINYKDEDRQTDGKSNRRNELEREN
jgi:hypothetical protein